MAKDSTLSPQISRLFSATHIQTIRNTTVSIALFSFVLSMYMVNILKTRSMGTHTIEAATSILSYPFEAQTHIKLAQYYKYIDDTAHQNHEISLTKELLQKNNLASVLGATRDINDMLVFWETEPDILRNKLAYWKQVIDQHPDFRDAYIQAAYISEALGETVASRMFIKTALELDPSIETIRTKEK